MGLLGSLLHKNGNSSAFPSLLTHIMTSEDVLSGAVAATLESRDDKPGDKSRQAYDGREQAQEVLHNTIVLLKECGDHLTSEPCVKDMINDLLL